MEHPRKPTDRQPPRRPRSAVAGAALLAVALALIVLPGPIASASPVPATTVAPAPGPSESWAWGALANFSASVQYVGAYNSSSNLTGGNLTSSGAYV
ncbi:MAG: hypothetical protein L3J81_06275, partial [Thermoplasmata archaeon]|nr:hypothetical protein [Thermoplasmata archaeon]